MAASSLDALKDLRRGKKREKKKKKMEMLQQTIYGRKETGK